MSIENLKQYLQLGMSGVDVRVADWLKELTKTTIEQHEEKESLPPVEEQQKIYTKAELDKSVKEAVIDANRVFNEHLRKESKNSYKQGHKDGYNRAIQILKLQND